MVLSTPKEVLEAMLSRIHVLIAYLDLDFRFVRVNDAYAQAGGHAPDYFVGKAHFELFPDEENEAIFRRVAETGETFVTYSRPFRYQDQPERGDTYWDWTLKRVVDDEGRPCGLLFTLVDVTERQRALTALQESMCEIERLNTSLEALVDERTAELREAMNELEAFSYSVSHDLRTPVNAIDGFSQILAERLGDTVDDDTRRLVDRIRQGAATMHEMIESLLDLSQATLADLHSERVDLSAMSRQILQELSERAPDRHVAFSVADGMNAEGDPRLLRILLLNLIGNAWKFTRARHDAKIEVASTVEDGVPAIVVRDNGAGFDMNQAARLFVPFQRLHGQRHFEGTGVGLATVQRIVRRHGGTIRAEGTPGEGAAFVFTIGTVPEAREP